MRARISRARPGAAAALLLACSVGPLPATAGDEVDYSAPYLVVEDGKLVTKYPAQEHAGKQAQAADTQSGPEDVIDGPGPARRVVVAVAVGAIVAGLFWLTRRRVRSRA